MRNISPNEIAMNTRNAVTYLRMQFCDTIQNDIERKEFKDDANYLRNIKIDRIIYELCDI
jgi:hypothetical protein